MAEVIEPYKDHVRLLIDSGAFTAWKAGTTIRKEEYAEFINRLPITPWRYFALDVVGDPKRTQQNLDWFLANGFTPTPVFQRGEPFDRLKDYASITGLVGVGLGVGSKGAMNYLRKVMQHTEGVNVHWLGITRPQWVTYYKPYSVDTSSWNSGRQYGIMTLYDRGRFWKWQRRNQTRPTKRYRELIGSYGFDSAVFQYEKAWRGSNPLSHQVTARGWVKYSKDIEERIRTYVFLGCIDRDFVQHAIHAWNWMNNEATL